MWWYGTLLNTLAKHPITLDSGVNVMYKHQSDRFDQLCVLISHQVTNTITRSFSRLVLGLILRAIGFAGFAGLIHITTNISFVGALLGIWSYYLINVAVGLCRAQSASS